MGTDGSTSPAGDSGRSWYRRFVAALDTRLILPGSFGRAYARREYERAVLVPPPIAQRFSPRLAALGFVGHGTSNDGGVQCITPPLCEVPAGPFAMGSDPEHDPEAEVDELPRHVVETGPYRIGAYPVTVAEYDCAVRAGAVREPRYRLITWTYQLQRLDAPVLGLSWEDATAYAAWLAHVTGHPWRLPTEAEWEKAARGPDGRRYPWGNVWDSARANVDKVDAWVLDHGKPQLAREMARHPERFEDEPTPVGAFAGHDDASPYGVHDLAGNVWEWTSSLHWPYPYDARDGREGTTADGVRVLRGGSWGNPASDARVANRNGNAPAEPDDSMGFRLVLGNE